MNRRAISCVSPTSIVPLSRRWIVSEHVVLTASSSLASLSATRAATALSVVVPSLSAMEAYASMRAASSRTSSPRVVRVPVTLASAGESLWSRAPAGFPRHAGEIRSSSRVTEGFIGRNQPSCPRVKLIALSPAGSIPSSRASEAASIWSLCSSLRESERARTSSSEP